MSHCVVIFSLHLYLSRHLVADIVTYVKDQLKEIDPQEPSLVSNKDLRVMHVYEKYFDPADYECLGNVYSRSLSTSDTNHYNRTAREIMLVVKMCAQLSGKTLKELLLESGLLIEEGHACYGMTQQNCRHAKKKCEKTRTLGVTRCEIRTHNRSVSDLINGVSNMSITLEEK